MQATMQRDVAHTRQQTNSSLFIDAIPRLTSDLMRTQLTAHFKRMQQEKNGFSSTPSDSFHPACSALTLATSDGTPASSMSTECVIECVNNLSLRGLVGDVGQASSLTQQADVRHACPDATSATQDEMTKRNDAPLFTIKQVGLVCERMLIEREEKLVQEYDLILTAKLSEQYDAFLKFNQDQLHRKSDESSSSYLS